MKCDTPRTSLPGRHIIILALSGWLSCIGSSMAGDNLNNSIADGRNVLVVANRACPGQNNREPGDSLETAAYYMKARNVPDDNLLIVDIQEQVPDYRTFHKKVITPLATKLRALKKISGNDRILYILCCYGMPLLMETAFPDEEFDYPADWQKPSFNPDATMKLVKRRTYANRRSADSFLCYPELLASLSPEEPPYSNRHGFGPHLKAIGVAPPDIHPFYARCVQPPGTPPVKAGYSHSSGKTPPMSFASARASDPSQFAYYLVCRLDAPSAQAARSLVDKAIYAEKHLVNPGESGNPPYPTECVFDLGELRETNLQIQDAIEWFRGTATGSPFLNKPWPMIVDTATSHGQEIGLPDANGMPYRPNDPGFANRQFPITNAIWYYGNYTTYGRYQDVYQWAVGSVGIHADSGCAANLRTTVFDTFRDNDNPPDELRPGFVPHAIMRNMTATAGTVSEPLEDGITAANFLFRALSLGMNFADAAYAATRDIWWKSIFVGDPLYTPFARDKETDTVPPRIISATAKASPDGILVSACSDKPCQFAVWISGRLARDFTEWGDTWETRDWFFAREFETSLKGSPNTDPGTIEVAARSPAGLVSPRITCTSIANPEE